MQVEGHSASGVMAALLGPAPAMAWDAWLPKGRVGPTSSRVVAVSFFAGSSSPRVRLASLPMGAPPFKYFRKSGAAVPFADEILMRGRRGWNPAYDAEEPEPS